MCGFTDSKEIKNIVNQKQLKILMLKFRIQNTSNVKYNLINFSIVYDFKSQTLQIKKKKEVKTICIKALHKNARKSPLKCYCNTKV